jgi:hypothetical protein
MLHFILEIIILKNLNSIIFDKIYCCLKFLYLVYLKLKEKFIKNL